MTSFRAVRAREIRRAARLVCGGHRGPVAPVHGKRKREQMQDHWITARLASTLSWRRPPRADRGVTRSVTATSGLNSTAKRFRSTGALWCRPAPGAPPRPRKARPRGACPSAPWQGAPPRRLPARSAPRGRASRASAAGSARNTDPAAHHVVAHEEARLSGHWPRWRGSETGLGIEGSGRLATARAFRSAAYVQPAKLSRFPS